MTSYKMFWADEKPRILFYVPDVISKDYAIVLYPGLGRPVSSYTQPARLFAREGFVAAVSEWHDGGHFLEEKMIEAVYRPVDFLKKEIGDKAKFSKVVGIGHSFGAHRLLKAVLNDVDERFSAIVLVQPPDSLKKYTRNHPYIYHLSREPTTRKMTLRYIRLMERNLNIRTGEDLEKLLDYVDNGKSLADMISTNGNKIPPSRFLFSSADRHVSHTDALDACELLRKNGHDSEAAGLSQLDRHITRRQTHEIFEYSRDFFDKICGTTQR